MNIHIKLRPIDWNDGGENGMYARMMRHKRADPSLKILLSYGGYNFGSQIFMVNVITVE